MAGKKNVLSSLAVYAEDSEPESDGDAGVETAGSTTGEARVGRGTGRIKCLPGMLLPGRAGGKERAIVPKYRTPDPHRGPQWVRLETLYRKNGPSSVDSIIMPKLPKSFLRLGKRDG